ncbi:hypothetical protein M8J77_004722 [Diaphorina citri]|nr:hypothetical protein M8J77_004722 [Diaphorina citri]
MIAPSAKKLWGVEEGKEDSHKTGGGGILNLNDQMWRDSTWSTSDHGVTQGMAMVPSARRPGATFPGTDNGAGVLSPRSSDSSGLGVKMVEYVLGTSPTSKDNGLEPRMRGLVLNSDGSDVKKEKDKAPASPYDVKKELVDASGAIQTNGMVPVVQNGIDNEDKYNRTPGSRQPSPTDDGSELAAVQAAVHHSHQASAAAHQAAQVQAHNQAQAQLHKAQQQQQQQQHGQQMHDVVIVQNHVGGAHSMLNHHGIPHLHQALPAPPPHPTHMSHIGDSVTQHFDHMMNMEAAGAGFESQYSGQGAPQQQPQQNTGAHAQPGMDSPNVLQPAFDVQIPCGSRSKNTRTTGYSPCRKRRLIGTPLLSVCSPEGRLTRGFKPRECLYPEWAAPWSASVPILGGCQWCRVCFRRCAFFLLVPGEWLDGRKGFDATHCSTTNRPARRADEPGPCDRVAAVTVLAVGGDRMSEQLQSREQQAVVATMTTAVVLQCAKKVGI